MARETDKPPIAVIAGATASGKSAFAVELACLLDGEIVGADSRQVYRFMDAATAKPSAEQRAAVAHHMIDVVDPDRPFDAIAWRRGAVEAIDGILARGHLPIVCGGTGLYLKALLEGFFDGPGADPQFRGEVLAAEQRDPGAARRRLQACDPEAAARIHENDLARTVRALEVFEATGRTLSAWHAVPAPEPHYRACVLQLEVARTQLYERIDARAQAMCRGGLLEELRSLRQRYPADARAFSAIGYVQAGQVLDGILEASELVSEVAKATRNYAKRQLTWMRGQLRAAKVDPQSEDALEGAAASVRDFVANRQGIG